MRPIVNIFVFICSVVSVVVYGLTIASAYGGYVDPRDFALLSVMFLAFPVMMFATIFLTCVWLLLRRVRMIILSAAVVVVCMPQFFVWCPINFDKNDDNGDLKVLSYNLYYGRDWEKKDMEYNRSISYVLKSDADIVCFQELSRLAVSRRVNITVEQFDSLRNKYPYVVETKGVDVMVLSKYPIEHIPFEGKPDLKKHRFEVYKVNVNGRMLTLVNVHLTSFRLKKEQLDVVENFIAHKVEESAKEMKDSVYVKLVSAFKKRAECAVNLRECLDTIKGDVIVCGDFNDLANSWSYRKVKGDDMKDAYREVCSGPIITYHANSMPFDIDHMLYRGQLEAVSFGRGSLKSSDHYPIMGVFKFENNKSNNITNQNLHNETQNSNSGGNGNVADTNF